MFKLKARIFLVFFWFKNSNSYAQQLMDKKATTETKNLYQNLIKARDKGIMFGHQDAMAYSVEWKNSSRKSDVYHLVNDSPAFYVWDIGKIEHKAKRNIDGVPFVKMRQYIKEAYDRGGVNTISWHVDNPVSLCFSWDNTDSEIAIKSVLKEKKSSLQKMIK